MARIIAQKTYDAVMMDSLHMMTRACFSDFGMDCCSLGQTLERFSALQNAARSGATVEQFDNAMGSGTKLTALVKEYGSNIIFPKSIWEEIEEEYIEED